MRRLEEAAEQFVDTLAEQVPEAIREPMRTPLARRIVRWLWRLLVLLYFVFVALVIALRYWVMPEIASYRPQIEARIGALLDRPVRIGALEAYWVGLRPALRLRDLAILDRQERPALQLANVDAHLSWDSFVLGQLRFSSLEIAAPDLSLMRDGEGRLFVAGFELASGASADSTATDWLLAQHSIVIRGARLRWRDDARKAPVLEADDVNLRIENSGRKHRFGLTAPAVAPLAGRLDVRGEFTGRGIDTWRGWSGHLYLDLANADIAALAPWFDPPPQLSQGTGSLRLWLDLADQSVQKLTADMRLKQLRSQIDPRLPVLTLRDLSGRVTVEHQRQATSVLTEQLELHTDEGLRLPATNVSIAINRSDNEREQGNATINTLDLEALASLASHLPLPASFAESLQQLAPRGQLSELRAGWSGSGDAPERWNISGRVERLSLKARGVMPGIRDLSGQVLGDQDAGRLVLAGQDAALELPAVFADPLLPLGKLDAVVEWNRYKGGGGAPVINLRRLSFENKDVAGSAKGLWSPVPDSAPGYIDLSAQITRANGTAVWRYMPLVAGAVTREWLRESIQGGEASDTALTLRGKLYDFPFRDPAQGSFEVRGKLNNVRLEYAKGWPAIEGINGQLLFTGASMLITADGATSLGAGLHKVQAQISDLSVLPTPLVITGTATGPTSEFLRFIEASPVGEMIGHTTRGMVTQGSGQLDLGLFLPLETLGQAKITGAYRFDANTLSLTPDLPAVTAINGQLNFTGDALASNSLAGTFLGGPVTARIRTERGVVHIVTAGEARASHLGEVPALAGSGLLQHLTGASKWNGALRLGAKGAEMNFGSTLVGLGSTLPVPFNKGTGETVSARYERKPLPGKAPGRQVDAGKTAPAAADEVHELSMGKQVSAQFIRRLDPATDAYSLVRGGIALGRAPLRLAERDLLVSVDLPTLPLDEWMALDAAPSGAFATATASPVTPWPALTLELRTDRLSARGRDFGSVRLGARRSPDATGAGITRADLRGAAISGTLEYREAGAGRLSGTLGQLVIPAAPDSSTESVPGHAPGDTPGAGRQLPDVDLTIERFAYKQFDLGTLKLSALGKPGLWDGRLSVSNPDLTLDGTIRWMAGDKLAAPGQTHADFRLDAKSLEHGFDRLGYPGSLKRGSGRAQGKLAWVGAPTGVDFSSLGGSFEIEAADGQFNKLEPGVGRLLGILSLQSLPRRITLDFRDVFSQGFAFDKIAGSFAVRQGVMATESLEIRGPAAKVLMRGQIDLGRETQNLTVRVQPALGDSLAMGAMIANPVVGAAVWATQKLLSDPLDRVFSYEYAITGSWSEPQVDKLGTNAPAGAVPKEPAATQ